MEKLFNTLTKVPDALALLAGFVLSMLLAAIYALAGMPPIFPLFFMLPIGLVTLATNASMGGALAIFSTILWLLVDLPRGDAGVMVAPSLINTLLGLALFLGTVYILDEFATVIKRERDSAYEDPLTGLPNLHGFFELAEREITRAKRNRVPISIAYIGIDNLDKVITQQGKKAANKILQQLAHSLVSNTRGTDVSARIGDSDFILLMSETGIEGGIKGIRRVNDLLMKIIEEYDMPVSFNIGLVTYNILPESIDQMIAYADAIKEESRQPGQDRIQHKVVDL